MLSAVSAFFEHVKPPHIFALRPSVPRWRTSCGSASWSRRFAIGARRIRDRARATGCHEGGDSRPRAIFRVRILPQTSPPRSSRATTHHTPHATADDSRLTVPARWRTVDALDRLRVSRAKHERRRGASRRTRTANLSS